MRNAHAVPARYFGPDICNEHNRDGYRPQPNAAPASTSSAAPVRHEVIAGPTPEPARGNMDNLLAAVAMKACDETIESNAAPNDASDAPESDETERLLVARELSLAGAKKVRKMLEGRGWMCNWFPEGKPAWFLYAHELALVGNGSVDGCMSHVWGGKAVKLTMNQKVLGIKMRQFFGKNRVVKANHAYVTTLERMYLFHCDGRHGAGSGPLLLRGTGDPERASLQCGSVACFSCGTGKRHLEAKISQITVHSSYKPGVPGCDSDEENYVKHWQAKMHGQSAVARSVSPPSMPRVIRRRTINFLASGGPTVTYVK